MVTYEAFADLVDDIAGSLPEAFFRDLNGGVNVKEECRIHLESLHKDLIILGEYCTDPYLGRMIHIYYGSFMRLYGTLDPGALKGHAHADLDALARGELARLGAKAAAKQLRDD